MGAGASSRPFDFAVAVSPDSGSAGRGENLTATVTVNAVFGSPPTVSLSASNVPQGVSVSFNPQRGKPPFSSAMTIQVGDDASDGTFEIKVVGSGGGLTRSATFTLTIGAGGGPYVYFAYISSTKMVKVDAATSATELRGNKAPAVLRSASPTSSSTA